MIFVLFFLIKWVWKFLKWKEILEIAKSFPAFLVHLQIQFPALVLSQFVSSSTAIHSYF